MASHCVLYKANKQMLSLLGLRDSRTEEYLNNQIVTVTLTDAAGTAVPGFDKGTMSYVPGSKGHYQYEIPATFNPTSGDSFTLVIKCEAVGFHIEVPVSLRTRRE